LAMQNLTFDHIDILFKRLKENEVIAKKFFEVEVSILSILDFKDFFERLLVEIKEKFMLPYVWISLIAPSKVSSLVQSLGPSNDLYRYLTTIERDEFLNITEGSIKPILINKHLDALYGLLPKGESYVFQSLAIVPITLDGQIVGSLNHASPSKERFQPGIDTSLLEQLGVVISICLSNVTAHEELRGLAYKDPLTGLLNRRAMERVMKREFSRARRYAFPLSIVFIDIDDFKAVNDRWGHERGDDLLRFIASNLMGMRRASDVIARFAGDEFIIILPGTTAQETLALMKRLKDYFLEHPMTIGKESIHVSLSFGISSAGDEGIKDTASLIKRADEMLYKAKAQKKPISQR